MRITFHSKRGIRVNRGLFRAARSHQLLGEGMLERRPFRIPAGKGEETSRHGFHTAGPLEQRLRQAAGVLAQWVVHWIGRTARWVICKAVPVIMHSGRSQKDALKRFIQCHTS